MSDITTHVLKVRKVDIISLAGTLVKNIHFGKTFTVKDLAQESCGKPTYHLKNGLLYK